MIGLLVENINKERVEDFTPIATQYAFEHYWLPFCEKYNFQWIPLFETGASFTHDDLPFILEEKKSLSSLLRR